MTHEEIWDIFKKENNIRDDSYEAYGFSDDEKYLIEKILNGDKTLELYSYEEIIQLKLAIPRQGDFSVILDGDEALCILKTKNVSILKFNEISNDLFIKLGNDDFNFMKIKYENDLKDIYKSLNKKFNKECMCVIEEYEVVYRRD